MTLPQLDNLPTIHWVPLLPPDRDDPPYEPLLDKGVGFCPELDAVLVARWSLARKVLGNVREYAPYEVRSTSWIRRALSAQRINSRLELMRAWVDVLLERLSPAGQAELDSQFAGPFVTGVINDLIGFPVADNDLIAKYRWATDVLASDTSPELDQVDAAVLHFQAHRYLTRLAAHHQPTGLDLIGDLIHAGRTADEIFPHVFAGWSLAEQATRNLVLFAVRDMLSAPSWSTAEPERCIEESLRRWSPHATVLRHTTGPVTLAQRQLPAGTRVGLVLGAANLDSAEFSRPREFDPTRLRLDRHLAFGHGAHRCPGAALARAATRIAIDALTQLPNLRLAEPDNHLRKPHPFLTGPDKLTVAWE